MNYFRCTVGGSGNGNTVTVTCAEEFAGLTITLAKTGKTYTKTCPSTAPYTVTFNGVENGTYTVSTLYNGRTYSEVVLVQDISCNLSYGFSWGTWVNTASELNLSDYDSLDELLADESAVRELFLEHACVDYMASVAESNNDIETIINNDICAKRINLSDYALDYLYANEVIADLMDEADKYFYGEWCLMPQVPTMTSNTAPYGEASATTIYSSDYPAWRAFDSSMSTNGWSPTAAGSATSKIYYHFTDPVLLKKVKIAGRSTAGTGSSKYYSGYIIASNDGENWSTISDVITVYFDNTWQEVDINNTTEYLYVGFQTTYCDTTTGCNGVKLQVYAWAPKGNVPVMTSNTAPYGTAGATSESSTAAKKAWGAFDGNLSTAAEKSTSNSSDARIYYKFTNPVNVKKVNLGISVSSENSFDYKIQYSDDGTNWTDATDFDTYAHTVGWNSFDLEVPDCGYHLYWGMMKHFRTNWITYANELQFYGRELKVSVPVMTGDTAPYGEAFGSSSLASNYHYYNAFTPEGITVSSTKYGWLPASNETTNCYVGYDFGRKVKIAYVEVQEVAGSGSAANNSTVIEGSDDGSNYSAMSESITITRTKTGYIISAAEHRYFRMFFSTINSTGNRGVICNFYGLDYSEKEFEAGTTKKWLYDHGLELEIMEPYTTGSGTVTKFADYIALKGTGTNYYAGVVTANKVNGDLLRLKVGSSVYNSANTTRTALLIISDSKTYTYGSLTNYVASVFCSSSDGPNNNSLDMSSISTDNYVLVQVSASSSSTNWNLDVAELWLE